MAYKKPILKAAMEETGWQEFLASQVLPASAQPFMEKTDMFRYPGGWTQAFFKGDVETTDQWIIVTYNGGFYKVGAVLMVWFGDKGIARWTSKSTKEAICAIMRGQVIPCDPNYRT